MLDAQMFITVCTHEVMQSHTHACMYYMHTYNYVNKDMLYVNKDVPAKAVMSCLETFHPVKILHSENFI